LDELEVDFTDRREVFFRDLHLDGGHFLDALEDVQPATPPVALEGVGGVGDQLQLPQYELRDDQDAVEKSGLGDVGDAAVDDDTGIENLDALPGLLLASEDSAQSGEVQQVPFIGAHDQADVGHQQHDHDLQEALRRAGRHAVVYD